MTTSETTVVTRDTSPVAGNNEIRLAIVGSRNYNDWDTFERLVDAWCSANGRPAQIVSGGASGADALAERYARERSIPLLVFRANWSAHGRVAGPLRNTKIVAQCSHVLAFPSRNGRGTQDTIRKAAKLRRLVTLHWT